MNKKLIGILLLWIGFFAGSLATVWKAPKKGVAFAHSLKTSEQLLPVLTRKVIWSAAVPLNAGVTPEHEGAVDKTLEQLKLVDNFTPNEFEIAESKPDGWHLINWVWYSLSAAVGVVGIVLIRLGVSEGAKTSDETKASLSEIKASLNRLVLNVEQLAKDSKQLPPSKILSRIDDELADDFLAFADGRESISAEHGLAVFADVMSSFASGERAVNRAWSAAADGYVNESEVCLERGSRMLRDAMQILESC